jgi:hypothetical protein
MKLLNIKAARSVWLFDLQDLNPRGKDIMDDLVDWIKDAYNFKTAPDVSSAIQAVSTGAAPQTFAFKGGHFQVREEIFIEVSLEIYNDGLVAQTQSSTHDTDFFLEDLLTSAAKAFGLDYHPSIIREKLYVSEVHVKSEVGLEKLNPYLTTFEQKLQAVIPRCGSFRAAGLTFWTEPNASGRHLIFALERQLGKSFAEQRYFSTAPLHTDEHLALLNELEQTLSSM